MGIDKLLPSEGSHILIYFTPKLAPQNFVSLKGTFGNCQIELTVAYTTLGD